MLIYLAISKLMFNFALLKINKINHSYGRKTKRDNNAA